MLLEEIIGYFLISLPFLVIFVVGIKLMGWKEHTVAIGIALVMSACVIVGTSLVEGGL